MPERSPPKVPDDTATQLFAEFVTARDDGRTPDAEAFYTRAGEHADELRKRIRALNVLDEVGEALRDDPDFRARPESIIGTRIGRYEIVRFLGRGGLSQVYVAFDPFLKREVALKVLADEQISDDMARRWIQREGRSLARLDHPGVVRVIECGITEDGRRTFIAMELVDGPSLADVLAELRARRNGCSSDTKDARVHTAADRLSGIGARATLALRIARALAACHAAEVLHRDVKPGNVLIQSSGEPKIIDFGLAYLNEDSDTTAQVTQRLVGTPAYIAPEQVESGKTGRDTRSDQFSFGVLLYESMTLVAPFQRSTRSETMDAVTLALPPPPRKVDPAIPADLETICLHALEREVADRYATMDALADDLEAFLDHRAISVAPPNLVRKTRLWARRNRRDLLMFGVPAAILAIGAVGWHWSNMRAARVEITNEVAQHVLELRRDQDPISIQKAFYAAGELARQAAEVDASLLLGFFEQASLPRVEEWIRSISHALAVELRKEQRQMRPGDRDEQAQIENDIFTKWQGALVLDKAFCPTCTENELDRERGRIELPPIPGGTKLEVDRIVSGSGPQSLEFIPMREPEVLGVGNYRVRLTDSEGRILAEIDCLVESRTQPQILKIEPIDPALRARFVRIPAGKAPLDAQKKYSYPYSEFYVLADWHWEPPLPDDNPHAPQSAIFRPLSGRGDKNLTPRGATRLASSLGARLPTLLESLALRESAANGLEGMEPLSPADIGGEQCGAWGNSDQIPVVLFGLEPTSSSPRASKYDGRFESARLIVRLVVSGPLAP